MCLKSAERRNSLKAAVKDTVTAMQYAYEETDNGKHTWGLQPAAVTVTLHVSNQTNRDGRLQVTAPIKILSLGGSFSVSKVDQRENTNDCPR